jgi:hypothetical protein
MYIGLNTNNPLFSPQLMKLEFSHHFFGKYSNTKFHENQYQWEPSYSMRTDEQTDVTKFIVAIQNFRTGQNN